MTADLTPPPSWLADALVAEPALGDASRVDCDVALLRLAALRLVDEALRARLRPVLFLPAVRLPPCEPLWDPAVDRRREDVF